MSMSMINRAGLRYGKLVAVESAGRTKDRKILWKCQCDCGNIATVRSSNLRSTMNGTSSCGCLMKEMADEHRRIADWIEERGGCVDSV